MDPWDQKTKDDLDVLVAVQIVVAHPCVRYVVSEVVVIVMLPTMARPSICALFFPRLLSI